MIYKKKSFTKNVHEIKTGFNHLFEKEQCEILLRF